MMFESAIHNITGLVPFKASAFPLLIEIGDGMGVRKVLCQGPDDVPQETDFMIVKARATTKDMEQSSD